MEGGAQACVGVCYSASARPCMDKVDGLKNVKTGICACGGSTDNGIAVVIKSLETFKNEITLLIQIHFRKRKYA